MGLLHIQQLNVGFAGRTIKHLSGEGAVKPPFLLRIVPPRTYRLDIATIHAFSAPGSLIDGAPLG
jgi:hypothetical protein